MSFKRNIEDFSCAHCTKRVKGTGYTNHCPHCLWSRHVDNNPGDRQNACGGLMRPIAVEGTAGNYRVVVKCENCSEIKRNILTPTDNVDAIVSLAGKVAEP